MMSIIRLALVIAAAGVTCSDQVKTPKAMITQRMNFKSVTDDLDFPYQSDMGAWPGGFNGHTRKCTMRRARAAPGLLLNNNGD
jgi:hypothetical protein